MSMLVNGRHRKTVKPSTCPNPLFEQWLEEWRLEAVDRNSDVQYCYSKALQSLRKYPIKMKSPKECLILKNFGNQLCNKLDRKLAEYLKTNLEFNQNNSVPQTLLNSDASKPSENAKNSTFPTKRKKNSSKKTGSTNITSPPASKKKQYLPGKRTATYAILITLLKEMQQPDYPGFLLKSDIQVKAQNLCDYSFTKAQPNTYYSAWSGMSTIIKKGFVEKHGCPSKYSLTEEGKRLAEKLLDDLNNEENSLSSKSSVSPLKHLDSSPEKFNFSPSPTKYQSKQWSSDWNCDNVLRSSLDIEFSGLEEREVNLRNDDNCDDICIIDDIHIGLKKSMEIDNIKDTCILSNQSSYKTGNSNSNTDSCPSSTSTYRTESSNTGNDPLEQLIFMPDEYKIILLVDVMETNARGKKIIDETTRELTNLGTHFEIRHLKVGDFIWIARNRAGDELVLPYIVERKRMDDLAQSIKSGRFHEQKFRLRQCRIPNVVYLVEKYGNDNSRLGLPLTTLQQAIVNTQMADTFFIKTTNNHSQSMLYLFILTNLLANIFKDKTLISCARSELPEFDIKSDLVSLQTFKEFAKLSAKHKKLKVRDIFIKQLLQLKGMSVDKALAITEKYPTPRCLMRALDQNETPENLLSNISYGYLGRNIGPTISKCIYELYTRKDLP